MKANDESVVFRWEFVNRCLVFLKPTPNRGTTCSVLAEVHIGFQILYTETETDYSRNELL